MAFWRRGESAFERLRDAEAKLEVPKKGSYPDVQALEEAIRKRAALAQEFQRAFEKGEITEEQYNSLVATNRRHSLGMP